MKYEEHKKGGKEKYFYQPLYSIQRGHAFKFIVLLEFRFISTPHLNLFIKIHFGNLSSNNLSVACLVKSAFLDCKGSNFSLNIKIFRVKR